MVVVTKADLNNCKYEQNMLCLKYLNMSIVYLHVFLQFLLQKRYTYYLSIFQVSLLPRAADIAYKNNVSADGPVSLGAMACI